MKMPKYMIPKGKAKSPSAYPFAHVSKGAEPHDYLDVKATKPGSGPVLQANPGGSKVSESSKELSNKRDVPVA